MARRARDLNMDVAGHLYDMALIHDSPHGRIAYKRAAQAVLRLEEPLDVFVRTHALREVPFIGPATERVIREVLESGESPTVARAIEKSGKTEEVQAARAPHELPEPRGGARRARFARAR